MPYKAIIDVFVQFESFRNIDLFEQGLYRLKCRLYTAKSSSFSSASRSATQQTQSFEACVPYAHTPHEPASLSTVLQECRTCRFSSASASTSSNAATGYVENFGSAYVSEADQSFLTRCFFIKYSEEEVELNDACEFRLELDAHEAFSRYASAGKDSHPANTALFIEVELLLADVTSEEPFLSQPQNDGASSTSNANTFQPSSSSPQEHLSAAATSQQPYQVVAEARAPDPPVTLARPTASDDYCQTKRPPDFKSVSLQTFRLHNFITGLHELCPIVFDDSHSSSVNVLLHTCLLDFRYRLKPCYHPLAFPPRGPTLNLLSRAGSAAVSCPDDTEEACSFLQSLYATETETAVEAEDSDRRRNASQDKESGAASSLSIASERRRTLQAPGTVSGLPPPPTTTPFGEQPRASRRSPYSTVWRSTAMLRSAAVTDRTLKASCGDEPKKPSGGLELCGDASGGDAADEPAIPEGDCVDTGLQPQERVRKIQWFYVTVMKLLTESYVEQCRCGRQINAINRNYWSAVGSGWSTGEAWNAQKHKTLSGFITDADTQEGGSEANCDEKLVDLPPLTIPGDLTFHLPPDNSSPGGDAPVRPKATADQSLFTSSTKSEEFLTALTHRVDSLYKAAVTPLEGASGAGKLNGNALAMLFTQDICHVSAQIFQVSRKLLCLLPFFLKELTLCYRYVWMERMRDRWGEWMLTEDTILHAETEGIVRPTYMFPTVDRSNQPEASSRHRASSLAKAAQRRPRLPVLFMPTNRRRQPFRDKLYADAASFSRTWRDTSGGGSQGLSVHIGELHTKVAESLRRSKHLTALPPLRVQDVSTSGEGQPVIFQQKYRLSAVWSPKRDTSPPSSPDSRAFVAAGGQSFETAGRHPHEPKDYVGIHLFVLVHGFQGSAFDMRLVKNNLSLAYASVVILCAAANQDSTEGDIEAMGQRLAEEVITFTEEWCPGDCLGRLSFIGHSLGGLIVRSALPHLKAFSNKLYTFISLSSPHLGYMHNANKLIDAGIWVLKKWRKSVCLQQLTMTDAKEPKETFLYKLSRDSTMQRFQHICLVSSYQDQYAPFDSARIELSNTSSTNGASRAFDSLTSTYELMAYNILGPIPPEKITRLDVNFRIPDKTLDSFIGRTAHIQFLECQTLMRMMLYCYTYLFR